jgi:predicted nucleic acid-binding protein
MIVDTSFLIALDNNIKAAHALGDELELADVPLRVPTPVIFELYASVGAGDDSVGNARSNEALIASKPVLELDENLARKGGVIWGTHRFSDKKPSLSVVDSMVSAAGLVFNEPVITNDVDDFGSVDGLAVESW